MKVFTQTAAALAASIIMSGAALAESDYVILEVGEHKIKRSEIEQVWQGLFPPEQAPDFDTIEEPIRQNVLRGALSEFLLYDEAVKMNLEQQEDVKQMLEQARRKILVRGFINHKTDNMITDKDVKAAYDDLVKRSRGKKEISARHILVEKEEDAKMVIEKLEKGESFEELAKQYSNDPGSKVRGGDLGFFGEGAMVEAFEKAAFALKKGKISEPVESNFGWHIIRVDDERDVKIASFTEMQDPLRKQLAEEKLNAYVNNLIDQNNVSYFGADGKKKELTKMPDSSKE